jgi:hypothetical protein
MAQDEKSRFEADVARLREEVEQLERELGTTGCAATDEMVGVSLLDAYLYDKPFDRHLFSRRPAKIAFLSAAFEMCDPEVIVSCLHFVKQTLTDEAFADLLNTVPRFKATYDLFSPPKRRLHRQTRDQAVDVRLAALRDSLPGASEIMKGVIENELKRITTRDKTVGVLPVDEKWLALRTVAKSGNYNGFTPSLVLPDSVFNKWKSGVDPMQAAIMARTWKMPHTIVRAFAQKATKAEQDELVARGVIAAVG